MWYYTTLKQSPLSFYRGASYITFGTKILDSNVPNINIASIMSVCVIKIVYILIPSHEPTKWKQKFWPKNKEKKKKITNLKLH